MVDAPEDVLDADGDVGCGKLPPCGGRFHHQEGRRWHDADDLGGTRQGFDTHVRLGE